MTYWLDYSAAKLPGDVIKRAGYTGVIRYIDSLDRLDTKHTSLSEHRSHLAAGLDVCLVMQTTTAASDGGAPRGRAHAQRALSGARALDYTGPIFFTNDRVSLPSLTSWRAYLDGAASVLGMDRVGAYGFRNAIDAALGHATYFWQAGRRSDLSPRAHLWQDNNTQVTVGGITCDRNLVLREITGTTHREDPNVKNLILARKVGTDGKPDPSGEIWVGDGITRRHVADTNELDGLRFWIRQKGGNEVVQDFADLRVLGDAAAVPVELEHDAFDPIDIAALADAVVEKIAAKLGTITWQPATEGA
jgi:hypothetical protein